MQDTSTEGPGDQEPSNNHQGPKAQRTSVPTGKRKAAKSSAGGQGQSGRSTDPGNPMPTEFKPVLNQVQQGEDAIYEGAITAFLTWKNWAMTRASRRPVNAATADLYEIVWRAWLRFLKYEQDKTFTCANTSDLEGFFRSLNAASKRNPDLHHAGKEVCDVSKRRYARILDDIYEASNLLQFKGARAQDWTPLKSEGEAVPKREDAETFLLNRLFRLELIKALPSGGTMCDKRDGAILSLMLLQGLTSQEVSMLMTASVVFANTTGFQEMQDPQGWPGAPVPLRIHVKGNRKAQERDLSLDARTAKALQDWVAVRGVWLRGRESNSLFLGTRGSHPMTNRALFEIASNFVIGVMKKQYVKTSMLHVGPMALRNSCLVAWLDEGMDPDVVRKNAGMEFLRSLERLSRRVSTPAQERLLQAIGQAGSGAGSTEEADAEE